MNSKLRGPDRLGRPGRHLLVFAGYYLAAQLGTQFMLPQANVALVWPAAGVALAAVFLLGPVYALTIAAAGFVFYYPVEQALLPAACVAGGNAVAAWLGASLLRWLNLAAALDRLRDVLVLVVAGALIASGLSSLAGAGVMWLAGLSEWRGFGSLWWVCWVADTVGVLLVAPVLLTWSRPPPSHSAGRRVELAVLTAVVAVAAWAVYADVLPPGVAMAKPLSYLAFPLFIWGGVRFSPRQVTPLLVLYAGFALAYTAYGHGPFAGGSLRESLLSLHGHLTMLAVTVLLLTAALCERARTSAALAESEAKYRLLVENQTDLVVKMCPEGNVLFASPSVSALLGIPERRMLGLPFRDFLRPLDAEAGRQAWQALLAPPHACYVEQTVETRRGVRRLGWAGKAVLDGRGRVEAVVVVGRDVTERRAAEEQARRHLEELAHVGRLSAMGEMAAGLAHELNQPLCAIMSFANASRRLLGDQASPELQDAIERVVKNAERAGGIVRQMRAFVRRDEPRLQSTDVNGLIEEVVELVEPQAHQQRVELRQELARGLPPVRLAPVQIHQVLVNLIRNAIDAVDGAPAAARRVEVRSRLLPARGVEISVSDTGPGVAPELREQLFQPFVSNKPEGMGLGLSISRSIVETHGGKLWVEDREEGGARFRFWLPVEEVRQSEVG